MVKSTRYRRLRSRDYRDRYRFVDLPEEVIRPRESNRKGFWDYVNPDSASSARSWIKFAKSVMGIKDWFTDASLGALSSLYAEYVNAYNQVYEAYALYRKGVESFDYYRDKMRQFTKDYPASPVPDKPLPGNVLPPTVVEPSNAVPGASVIVPNEQVPRGRGGPRDLGPPSTSFFPVRARAKRSKIRSSIRYELK